VLLPLCDTLQLVMLVLLDGKLPLLSLMGGKCEVHHVYGVTLVCLEGVRLPMVIMGMLVG
jgi:hypothetical protein